MKSEKKKSRGAEKDLSLTAEASGSAIFYNLDGHAEPLGPASEAELGRAPGRVGAGGKEGIKREGKTTSQK